MVFGVQWFLLNADVMPAGGEESKNVAPVLLSLTFSNPVFLITFHSRRHRAIQTCADSVEKEGNRGTKTNVWLQ